MSQRNTARKPVIDWLTVIGIAALAISFTVAFHEGIHALACLAVGGDLHAYSALYGTCNTSTDLQARIVAASGPVYNILAGILAWFAFRHARNRSSETQLFLWLFMLMNWFYGAGYFAFSGFTNVGDWSVVIAGLQPTWLWRVLMTVVGVLLFIFFIQQGLKEFGKVVCANADEQCHCANKLCFMSYFTSFVVILFAGFFCPYGLTSFPVTASLFAVAGALSPFLVMIRWFRTNRFAKLAKEPLEIHRKWGWIATSLVVVFVYVFILGQSFYF
jgi:hypothetical protein